MQPMTMGVELPAIAVLSVVAILVHLHYQRRRDGLVVPPGPTNFPIIGSLLVAPTQFQWIKYAQWAKEYGSDLLHLRVIGTSIIVLNSFESAQELLNRRSATSSSRPVGTMLNKLIGWDWNFGVMEYGSRWRDRRRSFWQEFQPSNSFNHQPVQLKYSRKFLKQMLDDPSDFRHHCRYTTASAIIEVIYGIPVLPRDDPTITLSEKALKHFENASITGSYLVDHIPALQYLPLWFPGAGFLRYAKVAYQESMDMVNIPFARTRSQIIDGSAAPSMISRAHSKEGEVFWGTEAETIVKDASSVAYAAGVDTTPSTIISFVAAMVLFPGVQKKAQDELDRVLGSSRLPVFDDSESLPYVQAVIWEILRWKPVIPLGLPHLLSADETYGGYFLPKGSTVFANVWAILRDETIFPNPEEFQPERFLTKSGEINTSLTEVVDIGFGFGRRICPGQFFARDSVFIWIASMLATFDIAPAKDVYGRDIIPNLEPVSSSVLTLRPFQCEIKARSRDAEKVIRDSDSA